MSQQGCQLYFTDPAEAETFVLTTEKGHVPDGVTPPTTYTEKLAARRSLAF